MRKLVFTLGLAMCLTAAASAQTDDVRATGTYTKSGQQILPQAGDIAIGIDATPILKYVGNMFNNTENNDASGMFNGVDQTIYGKYFLTDNSAIRVKLNMNFFNDSYKNTITDDANVTNNPLATTEDVKKEKTNEFGLWAGYEVRRGYGRLQGYIGGQVGIDMYSYSTSYEYGNGYNANNTTPTRWDYNSNHQTNSNYRPLDEKSGTTFGFGAGGFVGVEYFVGPKISIGGELSLNFLSRSRGEGEYKQEHWDSNDAVVKTESTKAIHSNGDATSQTGLYTQTKGNLYVMFHF